MSGTLRTTILKWLLLAALLSYAVGMTVWASERSAARICTGVEVEVNNVRPELAATIRSGIESHLARLVRVKGRPVGQLDLVKIQAWIASLNNLENASCKFAPDGRLVIHAHALVPEMRVFAPAGESYYVNRDGKRMQASAEFFTDVPIVTGRFNSRFTEQSLLPLIRTLNADPLLGPMTAMIDARSPNDIRLIPRAQGHTVQLGDTSQLDHKLTALKAFYRKVMPRCGWNTYEQISLKYAGRVIATLRNKPVVAAEMTDTLPDVEEQTLGQSEIEAPANPAPLTNR